MGQSEQKWSHNCVPKTSSKYHDIKWKHILQEKICKAKVKVKVHQMDSIDTKMIGFLMCKLPSEMNLCQFGDHLQQTAPETMPNIKLAFAFPKTQA
jgi:hypothetical protein